ncbi:hypothetical protein [Paenibacillus sp. OV219]|uniref:hypothetical protein n=1 Tax=Paenibacillus sp. OV219 TaxID=1884377 RepID=UPI0008D4608B|nr:hypothetical protein [Paenibacillus sp. OV219]SEO81554.1 hypothetical protein SAMN05518847_11177 [Paenibacillus sp. OV219]
MNTWLKWALILPPAFGFGMWLGAHHLSSEHEWLLLLGVFVLVFALFYVPRLHILLWTQNMSKVETFLQRTKVKYPQNGLLLDSANGEFDAVERTIPLIRNKQAQTAARISLHIERQELAEASQLVSEIRSDSHRSYSQALIAVLTSDYNRADTFKAAIRSKALRHVVDAEIAFRKGNQEEADQAGQLAMAHAGGVLKLMLTKSLERQKNDAMRRTYF